MLTWISSCITAAIEVDSGFPGGSDGKASAYNVGHRAQSLGQKDPLEKEMATHSHILVWRIPWTEEPGGRQSMGSWTWLRQLNMHAQQPIPQLQGSLALFQKSTLMPSVSSFPASQPTSHSQLQAQNVRFLFKLHRNPEHVERTKFRPSHCRASSV